MSPRLSGTPEKFMYRPFLRVDLIDFFLDSRKRRSEEGANFEFCVPEI